ncbi:hypothetical protein [Zavarzinella formosa]|uniref:hypothetical protein n=1 Tax=Zavarzinella formosa TaxID=360055 RepID=UPI0012F962B7|nr:hypothetical protein [Zavarzinella formosa]
MFVAEVFFLPHSARQSNHARWRGWLIFSGPKKRGLCENRVDYAKIIWAYVVLPGILRERCPVYVRKMTGFGRKTAQKWSMEALFTLLLVVFGFVFSTNFAVFWKCKSLVALAMRLFSRSLFRRAFNGKQAISWLRILQQIPDLPVH